MFKCQACQTNISQTANVVITKRYYKTNNIAEQKKYCDSCKNVFEKNFNVQIVGSPKPSTIEDLKECWKRTV